MTECARPDCCMAAKSSCFCSGCGREQYCGRECQKLDWRKHKPNCLILKKLSKNLQPYNEVVQVIEEILASKKPDDIRVLEHLLSYTEYQFGNIVTGIDYRQRVDGQRISNWKVDIDIIHKINNKIANIYVVDGSINDIMSLVGLFGVKCQL
jgi:hypothetical protein